MTSYLLTALRRRLSREDGSAMMVAIIVLLVVTILATVTVATATQTNLSTRRDANYKNATEASEAGLQIAVYRLNMLNPDSTHCVGDAVASAGSNGWCQSSTYTLGNGSTYTYYTTPVMGSSFTCIGLTITTSDVNQRCVTSVGTSHGVTARSQIRTGAFAAEPLFPAAGVVGLKTVGMSGNAAVTGSAASNGTVSQTGNANSQGVILGPAGTYTHSGKANGGTVSKLTSPLVLDPVDPGTSNQTSLANCPARQQAGYPSCNDDYRITNGKASPVTSPYDQSSGISWNPATRVLSMSGQSSLTLGGGLYNFCNISMSGQASITLASGVMAEIFIDSPDDPGSGCASGTGNMTLSGQGGVTNSSLNPLALQFYVYGNSNGSSTVSYSGNANMYGIVYAPQSSVSLTGNGTLIGGLAATNVTISGNGFNWDGRAGTLQATTAGIAYRTGWAQCSATPPTASNPGSGCG